jgi:hypothetical protein
VSQPCLIHGSIIFRNYPLDAGIPYPTFQFKTGAHTVLNVNHASCPCSLVVSHHSHKTFIRLCLFAQSLLWFSFRCPSLIRLFQTVRFALVESLFSSDEAGESRDLAAVEANITLLFKRNTILENMLAGTIK